MEPFLGLDGIGGWLQYIRQGEGANSQIKVVENVVRWYGTWLSTIYLAMQHQGF